MNAWPNLRTDHRAKASGTMPKPETNDVINQIIYSVKIVHLGPYIGQVKHRTGDGNSYLKQLLEDWCSMHPDEKGPDADLIRLVNRMTHEPTKRHRNFERGKGTQEPMFCIAEAGPQAICRRLSAWFKEKDEADLAFLWPENRRKLENLERNLQRADKNAEDLAQKVAVTRLNHG